MLQGTHITHHTPGRDQRHNLRMPPTHFYLIRKVLWVRRGEPYPHLRVYLGEEEKVNEQHPTNKLSVYSHAFGFLLQLIIYNMLMAVFIQLI